MDDKTTTIQTRNMFTESLGEKYAKKFSEVFEASIKDQDKLMTDLYNESKDDPDLTEKQKKTIYGCTVAYNIAQAEKAVSTPIIAYVSNHKPNLTKAVTGKNFKRYKRTIEDLFIFGQRTGFFINIAELPKLLKQTELMFGFRKKEDANKTPQEIMQDYEYEVMYIAAISKFARGLHLDDLIAHWYTVILLKQIQLLAFVNPDMMQEIPGLKEQAKNLIKTVNYIHHMEMERMNLKTKNEAVNKELEEKEYDELMDKTADTVLQQTASFNEQNNDNVIVEEVEV